MEDKSVKYVPIEIYCVWVSDNKDKTVELIGQLPRDGLDEETVDIPDWVYATREYSDGKEERIYNIHFGTLDEFMDMWLAAKMEKASFNIAGLQVY